MHKNLNCIKFFNHLQTVYFIFYFLFFKVWFFYKVSEDDVVERKLVVVGISNNATCYIRCHGKSADIFFLISLATSHCGF
jgi:hypothetical protein